MQSSYINGLLNPHFFSSLLPLALLAVQTPRQDVTQPLDSMYHTRRELFARLEPVTELTASI